MRPARLAKSIHENPTPWLHLEESDLPLFTAPPEITRQHADLEIRFNVPENNPRDFSCNASPRPMHHRRHLQINAPVMVRLVFAILLLGAPLATAGNCSALDEDLEWVNLRDIAPNIRIELRYATSKNIARSPLYPCGMPQWSGLEWRGVDCSGDDLATL